jgi:hypothetical protein
MTPKILGKIAYESWIHFCNHGKTTDEQYGGRDGPTEKAFKNVIGNMQLRSSDEEPEESTCSQSSGSASEHIYSSTD